jgi:hypothetical protein
MPRRSRPRRTILAAVAGALALLACGREYVELANYSDASTVVPDEGCVLPMAVSGACFAPGTPCGSRSDCCSGRCDPEGGDGIAVCLNDCAANGAMCSGPQDCCSLACNANTCGGMLCQTSNSNCSNDSDCCSSRCHMGHCVTERDEQCLPTGEGCGPDAGGGHCCSMQCDPQSGRCDFGPGPCLDPAAPCGEMDPPCCAGSCTGNGQGVSICQPSACLADGASCNLNVDCCGGTCAGSPPTCSSLPVCP